MVIAVIDYGAGNLRSVVRALKYIGVDYYVSNEADKLFKGDKIIFPGVGHAKCAMQEVNKLEIADMLRNYASTGKNIFGICLGSQILLEHSEEGDTACMGLIKGNSLLFKDDGRKIPHMGWNQVYPSGNNPLFSGIPAGSSFYFVHSYYTVVGKENTLCTTEYGETFTSGITKDNISAVQFHPEKSGAWGLKMLENFVKM